MAELYSFPLSTNFTGTSLETMGSHLSGNTYPDGVQGRIEIIDQAAVITVDSDDPQTFGGLRSEIHFPSLPNTGEVWSQMQFMIDPLWQYQGISGLGSWYPSLAPEDYDGVTVKHVVLGLRIVNSDWLYVDVPQDMPVHTNIKRTVAWAKLQKGQWYTVTMRANFQSNNTGWREIYLNNVPIFKEAGIPTMYDDVYGPIFKAGPRTLEDNYDRVRMWLKNVICWSGNQGFQTVMGGVPLAPPRLQQI